MKSVSNVETNRKRIAVALSGGVDSATTAYLLKQLGHDVFGLTMKVFPEFKVEDAKKVAEALGIEHYVLDFTKEFEDFVIEPFIQQYLSAATPNPCIMCNKKLKYGLLLDKALSLGADFLALGHYADISYHQETKCYQLRKCSNRSKDQSYVLYHLKQEQLKHILLPLNSIESKEKVRAILKEAIPSYSQNKDSMGICFIPDGNFSHYIKSKRNLDDTTGNFITKEGEILGTHQGIHRYTIGQKRGLNLTKDNRYFVYQMDKDKHTIMVTENENDLYTKEIKLIDVSFTHPKYREEAELKIITKICQWGYDLNATLYPLEENTALLVFDQPERAPSPGQAAVFYLGDEIIGGGTILLG